MALLPECICQPWFSEKAIKDGIGFGGNLRAAPGWPRRGAALSLLIAAHLLDCTAAKAKSSRLGS